MFQSTFPRGERQERPSDQEQPQKEFQSTFPRGERPCQLCGQRRHCRRFNPRSREGNDTVGEFTLPEVVLFQSTFPRGERLLLR